MVKSVATSSVRQQATLRAEPAPVVQQVTATNVREPQPKAAAPAAAFEGSQGTAQALPVGKPQGSSNPMQLRMQQLGGVGDAPVKATPRVLRFDAASSPEVQGFAAAKGWKTPGMSVNVYAADLVFSTDNWKTTQTAKLQYMRDNVTKGFVLPDVPAGSTVEYAIHAFVAQTYKNNQYTADRGELWLNNGGNNLKARAEDLVTP